MSDWRRLDRRWNCRLTTTGRKSGEPRSVTIWFVLDGPTLYLAGSAAMPHWCKNLAANGEIGVEIAGEHFRGSARVVEDEQAASAVRDRFVRKYLLARLSRPFGGYTQSVAVEATLTTVEHS
jgi:deazaflavin-dependent oxidoreductase (nitroreductase family)